MLKLVTGMQNNRGFTLIEILVVILIIGITLGFALLAFGDFGRERRLMVAAEYFIHYIQFAEQQAILENNTLGLVIDGPHYQLLRFHAPNQWQALSNHAVFRQQHFPNDTFVHFTMENTKNADSNHMIIINTSGDITPFKLQLGLNDNQTLFDILGNRDGSVSLQRKQPS